MPSAPRQKYDEPDFEIPELELQGKHAEGEKNFDIGVELNELEGEFAM